MTTHDPNVVADRYTAIWSEPDAARRRSSIAALWADDGVEYIEGTQFRGLDALDSRIGDAYAEFVGSGQYVVARADDATAHDDVVVFTIELRAADGSLAWAARVFLVLDPNGRIGEDYQLTVRPLPR